MKFEEYLKICWAQVNPRKNDAYIEKTFPDWVKQFKHDDYLMWADFYGYKMYMDGQEGIPQEFEKG